MLVMYLCMYSMHIVGLFDSRYLQHHDWRYVEGAIVTGSSRSIDESAETIVVFI